MKCHQRIIAAYTRANSTVPLSPFIQEILENKNYTALSFNQFSQLLDHIFILLNADKDEPDISLISAATASPSNGTVNIAYNGNFTPDIIGLSTITNTGIVLTLQSNGKTTSDSRARDNDLDDSSANHSDRSSNHGSESEGSKSAAGENSLTKSPPSSSVASAPIPLDSVSFSLIQGIPDVHFIPKLSTDYTDFLQESQDVHAQESANSEIKKHIQNTYDFLNWYCERISAMVEGYYLYQQLKDKNLPQAQLALLGIKEKDVDSLELKDLADAKNDMLFFWGLYFCAQQDEMIKKHHHATGSYVAYNRHSNEAAYLSQYAPEVASATIDEDNGTVGLPIRGNILSVESIKIIDSNFVNFPEFEKNQLVRQSNVTNGDILSHTVELLCYSEAILAQVVEVNKNYELYLNFIRHNPGAKNLFSASMLMLFGCETVNLTQPDIVDNKLQSYDLFVNNSNFFLTDDVKKNTKETLLGAAEYLKLYKTQQNHAAQYASATKLLKLDEQSAQSAEKITSAVDSEIKSVGADQKERVEKIIHAQEVLTTDLCMLNELSKNCARVKSLIDSAQKKCLLRVSGDFLQQIHSSLSTLERDLNQYWNADFNAAGFECLNPIITATRNSINTEISTITGLLAAEPFDQLTKEFLKANSQGSLSYLLNIENLIIANKQEWDASLIKLNVLKSRYDLFEILHAIPKNVRIEHHTITQKLDLIESKVNALNAQVKQSNVSVESTLTRIDDCIKDIKAVKADVKRFVPATIPTDRASVLESHVKEQDKNNDKIIEKITACSNNASLTSRLQTYQQNLLNVFEQYIQKWEADAESSMQDYKISAQGYWILPACLNNFLFTNTDRLDSVQNFMLILQAVKNEKKKFTLKERVEILLEYIRREKEHVLKNHKAGNVLAKYGFTSSSLFAKLDQQHSSLLALYDRIEKENAAQSEQKAIQKRGARNLLKVIEIIKAQGKSKANVSVNLKANLKTNGNSQNITIHHEVGIVPTHEEVDTQEELDERTLLNHDLKTDNENRQKAHEQAALSAEVVQKIETIDFEASEPAYTQCFNQFSGTEVKSMLAHSLLMLGKNSSCSHADFDAVMSDSSYQAYVKRHRKDDMRVAHEFLHWYFVVKFNESSQFAFENHLRCQRITHQSDDKLLIKLTTSSVMLGFKGDETDLTLNDIEKALKRYDYFVAAETMADKTLGEQKVKVSTLQHEVEEAAMFLRQNLHKAQYRRIYLSHLNILGLTEEAAEDESKIKQQAFEQLQEFDKHNESGTADSNEKKKIHEAEEFLLNRLHFQEKYQVLTQKIMTSLNDAVAIQEEFERPRESQGDETPCFKELAGMVNFAIRAIKNQSLEKEQVIRCIDNALGLLKKFEERLSAFVTKFNLSDKEKFYLFQFQTCGNVEVEKSIGLMCNTLHSVDTIIGRLYFIAENLKYRIENALTLKEWAIADELNKNLGCENFVTWGVGHNFSLIFNVLHAQTKGQPDYPIYLRLQILLEYLDKEIQYLARTEQNNMSFLSFASTADSESLIEMLKHYQGNLLKVKDLAVTHYQPQPQPQASSMVVAPITPLCQLLQTKSLQLHHTLPGVQVPHMNKVVAVKH